MNRILGTLRARVWWSLWLLLSELVLTGAPPELAAAKSGIDLAAAQLIVAREFPNPSLSISTAKIDPNGNGTSLGNELWDRSYDTIAAVSQLIEIAGKRGARQSSARAGIEGARARFFEARRALDQGLTKAYVTALLAEENARVLNESARSLQRQAAIADIRFRSGDISDSDLKQIQNSAEVFDLQAKSAQAAAVQGRISVEILMGVHQPKGDWIPVDSLESLSVPIMSSETHSSAGARPDVMAAEADLRKAKSDVELQKALRIPDPTFSVLYERNPPGPPGPDTLGVGVSFPLPLWNRNRGNISAAEASREQSALALSKLEAQAKADLAAAQVAYQEADTRLKRYQEQILPRSAQVRESVAFAYSKGGASLVDLLTAERDDNNIRLAIAQARSDRASAAADLRAAATTISPNQLTH
jgi:cobalt-zinc-cadmium efflux system outer membrane protein